METKSPSPKSPSTDAAAASSTSPRAASSSDAPPSASSTETPPPAAESTSGATDAASNDAKDVAEAMITDAPPAESDNAAPKAVAVAVAVDDSSTSLEGADLDALLARLEREELESPAGVASADVYGRLLLLYLLVDDAVDARLAWKRVPDALKAAHPELAAAWNVGQRAWASDFPGVHAALRAVEWPPRLRPLIERLAEETRRRAVALVARAYDSIKADNLAAVLGAASAEEAKRAATALEWRVEGAFVFPKKPERAAGKLAAGELELAQLTDYVSFLENH